MDLLRPELYWVDGRCYRKNPSKNNYGLTRSVSASGESGPSFQDGSRNAPSETAVLKPYEEEDNYCDPDAPDDIDEAEYMNIEKLESGTFKTKCDNIPSSLFSVIVGAKGATKKRLEFETHTKIIIPFVNEKGDIVIRGQNRKDVIAARRRIEHLTSRARFKRDPTHFVCFPLNSKNLFNKIRAFQEFVAEEYPSSAFPGPKDKIFQDAQKIHLTICVLVVFDNRERQLVADLLKKIKPDILEKFGKDIAERKLRLQLKGVEIMNDDPSQVDVLYAKCYPEGDTIQRLGDYVNERFLETGLAKSSKSSSIKLHATLMNTRHLLDAESEKGPQSTRNSFDARPILEKYRDFDFGTVDLTEIHVSVRYTTNPTDGFYNSSAKISLG